MVVILIILERKLLDRKETAVCYQPFVTFLVSLFIVCFDFLFLFGFLLLLFASLVFHICIHIHTYIYMYICVIYMYSILLCVYIYSSKEQLFSYLCLKAP